MDEQNMQTAMPASGNEVNNSGQGEASVLPAELQGWNWGAFLLSWIWGIFNSTYLALLVFIPFIGIVMLIVLGVKGNEWAWKNKKWDSIEHFKKTQKTWAMAGFILLGVSVLFGILMVILAAATATVTTTTY